MEKNIYIYHKKYLKIRKLQTHKNIVVTQNNIADIY